MASSSLWSGFLRVALYLLCTVFALIMLTFVRPHTSDGLIHQIGKNCALVAFIILALQVVLAARIKWIERPFGLDMIFQFHKAAAILALGLLLLHFTLVAWGSNHWRILTALDIRWPVWLGRLALLTLVVNVITSLWRRKLHIEFQAWRSLHNILGVVIVSFGFVHGYRIGGDLTTSPMRIYWITALVSVAMIYLFHKAARPAWLKRNPYTVTAVRQEAPKIWTIHLEPPAGKSVYPYAPGQFHYMTFRRGSGLPVEEHHWTISSTPTRPGVASTIKEVGDFTSTIGQTKIGDTADVDGAYGRFSYLFYPDEDDLLFICGGIGITPFLAMLRHMHDAGARKRVLLLWNNRTEQDLMAREELDQIARSGRPQLKVVLFLTRPGEDWQGERGRINRQALATYWKPEAAVKRGVYVCCPPPMSRDVIRALRDLGTPVDRIHDEGFSL
jgi:predicted ferric reductase